VLRFLTFNLGRTGMSKKPMPPSPITSPNIKKIAGKGLAAPSTLTTKQVRELAGAVMAHIEPRGSNKPKKGN
jgi:hypothetical protein